MYCMFLKAVIPIFNSANVLLQRDEPCIYIFLSTLRDQLKDDGEVY